MKSCTRWTKPRFGMRPALTSITKFGSLSAALPKALADISFRFRKESISERKFSAGVPIKRVLIGLFLLGQEESNRRNPSSLKSDKNSLSGAMDVVRKLILERLQ